MRLHKQLTIAGKTLPLISDKVVLELHTPGRAVFVVHSSKALSGLVRYAAGYDAQQIPVILLGYVEQSFPMDNHQQRIVVRELSAALNRPMPLSLRHCQAADVLQQISAQTGLPFILQEAQWCQQVLPTFYHIGGGYMAMDALGQALRIPQYLWQQQIDGKIWLGSWEATPWAKQPLVISPNRLTKLSAGNSANLPLMPKIRPGPQLQIGHTEPVIVTRVECDDANMTLHWRTNPWRTPYNKAAAP